MISYLAIIFLSFAGFLLSYYLHHKKKKPEPMVCPLHGQCKEVITSEYSTFLGLENTMLGMAYYLALAIAYAFAIIMPDTIPSYFGVILFSSTLIAFLFSVYLTAVQVVSLHQFCGWCLTSAAICTLIFGFALGSSVDLIVSFLAAHKQIIAIAHVFFMALGLGVATITDLSFFKFLKDLRISKEEADTLSLYSQVIWFALAFVVVTGVALFIPDSDRLLLSSKFIAKMIIVSIIILNGVVLNLFVAPKMIHITFAEKHDHKKGELHKIRRVAFMAGPISIISWYSAFLLGSFRSLPMTSWQILAVYGAVIVVGIFSGLYLEKHYKRKGLQISL